MMRSKMILTLLVLAFGLQAAGAVEDFATYLNSASDKRLSMNIRWNSLVKAAGLANPQQLEKVRQFARHTDWYMRNATLVALKQVSLTEAAAQARRLLTDKALVVRSAAVDILTENITAEDRQLLMSELNKPYNFNKKSSLWIRKQIVEKLALTAGQADRNFFAKAVFDTDQDVARIGARTLAKITGQPYEEAQPLKQWQNLIKEKNWL